MTLPAITNARLTSVVAEGYSPDYDQNATGATTKFTGSEPAYFSQEEAVVSVGNTADIIMRQSLVVRDTLAVAWAVDDRVTITFNGGTVFGVVRFIRTTVGDGLDGVVRLTLSEVTAGS